MAVTGVVPAPALFAFRSDGPLVHQLAERAAKGSFGDLFTHAPVDVRGGGPGVAGDVLHDQRAEPVRLDALQGGLTIEPDLRQQGRLDELPGAASATRLLHEAKLHQAPHPRSQRRRIGELEGLRELGRRHRLALPQEAEGDPLALSELVPLVRLADEPDDVGVDDPPLYDDVHRVDALGHRRGRPPAREETIVHEIEPAALALHELEVVEDPGEAVVPASARMENVGWG